MTVDPIRELIIQYADIIGRLNTAIDLQTKANNEIAVAKAEVEKCKHQKKLLEEQIMVEKKLMDIK